LPISFTIHIEPMNKFSIPSGSQIAAWLSRLVQIPSVTPDQAGPRAGEPGEARLAAEVARWFSALGGEVQSEDVLPGRPNIYGLWRGEQERWLAVDVHLDTVSVELMSGDPFDGRIADGRVYGRGAVDTTASLAIMLALLEAMQQTGRRPAANVLIAATVDEEVGATGAPAAGQWILRQGLQIAELLVGEATLCAPIHGHKGVVRLEFHVRGKSVHSSQPHLGQNAVVAAAQLVMAMQAEHERLQRQPPAELGLPALTVSIIRGGSGINVVPDACQVSVDRRVVDGEQAVAVVAQLHELAMASSPLPVSMVVQKEIDAFYQAPNSPWIRQLVEWTGHAPQLAPYGTNAWGYAGVAAERVVFGPGSIDQAHGAEEWVAIAQLEEAVALYARWWGL
jgi:acetylornithine deacetylase/succinyl-diaminopimelate desuccinylase-like protein